MHWSSACSSFSQQTLLTTTNTRIGAQAFSLIEKLIKAKTRPTSK
jgi:hypothetical protein